jgi:hypothetical protein
MISAGIWHCDERIEVQKLFVQQRRKIYPLCVVIGF